MPCRCVADFETLALLSPVSQSVPTQTLAEVEVRSVSARAFEQLKLSKHEEIREANFFCFLLLIFCFVTIVTVLLFDTVINATIFATILFLCLCCAKLRVD